MSLLRNTTLDKRKTEILHGVNKVINAELQLFSSSKKKIDTCMNYTRPPLAIEIESIRDAFVDAKKRGIRLRYVTEITKENSSCCKELMSIVDELRHLDKIRGSFIISETEYLAPIILFEKGKVASQIIHSNVEEIVEQQQYVFDTLWSRAISAEQRIREIEEGIEPIRTRIIENQQEIIKEIKRKNNAANKLSICTSFGGMQMSYNYLIHTRMLWTDTKKEKAKRV
jgi:two-component system sensor histidine kinase VicK